MPTLQEKVLTLLNQGLAPAGGAATGLALALTSPSPENNAAFFNSAISDINPKDLRLAQYALFALAGAFVGYLSSHSTAGKLADEERRSWLGFILQLTFLGITTLSSSYIAGTAYPEVQPSNNSTVNEALACTMAALIIGTGIYLGIKPLINSNQSLQDNATVRTNANIAQGIFSSVFGASKKEELDESVVPLAKHGDYL
jgi:hypothetical protein